MSLVRQSTLWYSVEGNRVLGCRYLQSVIKKRPDWFFFTKTIMGSKRDTIRHLATYMTSKTRGVAFVYIKSLRRSSGTCVNLLVALGNGNDEWIRVAGARNFVSSLRQKCNRYIRDGSTSLWYWSHESKLVFRVVQLIQIGQIINGWRFANGKVFLCVSSIGKGWFILN